MTDRAPEATARRVLRAVAFALALGSAAPSLAVTPDEVLADRALEGRARAISAELRCLVCQNQSIDDSDAPLARDLRRLVRERLAAGETDTAVRAFVVSRYGDFVLLRPPFKLSTAVLWLGPLMIVSLGVVGIVLARRRSRAPLPVALSDEERRRISALTGAEGGTVG